MPKGTRQQHKARRKPPVGGGLVHSARLRASSDAGRTHGDKRSKPHSLAPWGWLNVAPIPINDDTPAPCECAAFRRSLLDWVAVGLGRAQLKHDVHVGPRTDVACWDGDVVEVYGGAVATADAVILLSIEFAEGQGYCITQRRRGDVRLDEDLDRRVLACWCNHEECRTTGNTSVLEMQWAVANAALERQRPDIGFVAPPPPVRFKDVYPNGSLAGAMLVLMSLGANDHGGEPIDTRRVSGGGTQRLNVRGGHS